MEEQDFNKICSFPVSGATLFTTQSLNIIYKCLANSLGLLLANSYIKIAQFLTYASSHSSWLVNLIFYTFCPLGSWLTGVSLNSALPPPRVLYVWLSCLYFLSGYQPVSFLLTSESNTYSQYRGIIPQQTPFRLTASLN